MTISWYPQGSPGRVDTSTRRSPVWAIAADSDRQPGDPDRFFIKIGEVEREVSRAEFIAWERAAGFHARPGHLATSGFSSPLIRGRVEWEPKA